MPYSKITINYKIVNCKLKLDIMQQKIIILDFGSQTTQLIGRRVRELDTFCEIMPYNKFPRMTHQSLVSS